NNYARAKLTRPAAQLEAAARPPDTRHQLAAGIRLLRSLRDVGGQRTRLRHPLLHETGTRCSCAISKQRRTLDDGAHCGLPTHGQPIRHFSDTYAPGSRREIVDTLTRGSWRTSPAANPSTVRTSICGGERGNRKEDT